MAALTVECVVCDTLLEAGRVLLAVHRLNKLINGRDFPYTTPLSPADRVGPDDGSTVIVRRHVRPYRMTDGKIAVPVTALVRALITSGRLGEVSELTVTQRQRLQNLWAARRTLADSEISDDQAGIDE